MFGHRWEDNFDIDIKDIGFKIVDWMHLALGGVQNLVLVTTVMNLRVS
jgi:hypothetical protein